MDRLKLTPFCALLILAALFSSVEAASPELYELPNGFRIVFDPMEGTGVVSFGIWVGAGSVHEENAQAGIAHMLEHMLFKGSKNFPAGEAERIIESLGGRMNGATSFEYTYYYISIASEHFEAAFRVLADMLKNPLFCPGEFSSERMVVLREIDQREDDPVQRSARMFYQAAYPGHYYGRPIIGFRETLESMTIQDLRKFHEKNYVPSAMVLSAAGDIRKEDVLSLAAEHFGDMAPGRKPSPVPPGAPPKDAKALERADIRSAYLWLGNPGPPISIESIDEAAALSLGMDILGRGRSSRLHQALREDKNIVNSVSAGFSLLPRGGPVYVRAQFEPEREEEVLEGLMDEIKFFIEEGPGFEEVERAKTLISTDIIFGFEASSGRMRTYGNYAATGNMEFFTRYLDAVRRQTPKTVAGAVREFLFPQEFAGARLLPALEGEK